MWVSDKTGNKNPVGTNKIKPEKTVKMHYLRLSFPRTGKYVTPKLAEVEILGQVD